VHAAINSQQRTGSLREATGSRGLPLLLGREMDADVRIGVANG
jgi:hypothetical protein